MCTLQEAAIALGPRTVALCLQAVAQPPEVKFGLRASLVGGRSASLGRLVQGVGEGGGKVERREKGAGGGQACC